MEASLYPFLFIFASGLGTVALLVLACILFSRNLGTEVPNKNPEPNYNILYFFTVHLTFLYIVSGFLDPYHTFTLLNPAFNPAIGPGIGFSPASSPK